MKVWLDDVRTAPAGWLRCWTPEEVIERLRTGEVAVMSLDHDLGLDTPEAERTGYNVLLWLEAEVGSGSWSGALPEIRTHSANPVGRERMRRAIASIERLHDAKRRPPHG